jgi:hypothetical protein
LDSRKAEGERSERKVVERALGTQKGNSIDKILRILKTFQWFGQGRPVVETVS